MSFITCGSKNPELPYLDKMILKAFSTSEENFRTMCSPVSCCFGGCHAEAAPQCRSWMKPQGGRAPGGPLRRGEPGWRQHRVAAGQQNRGLAGLTPVVEERRAAPLPRLCEHDGCHRYSKLISCNCAGRPRVSIICS